MPGSRDTTTPIAPTRACAGRRAPGRPRCIGEPASPAAQELGQLDAMHRSAFEAAVRDLLAGDGSRDALRCGSRDSDDVVVMVTNGEISGPARDFSRRRQLHLDDRHLREQWARGRRPLREILPAVAPPGSLRVFAEPHNAVGRAKVHPLSTAERCVTGASGLLSPGELSPLVTARGVCSPSDPRSPPPTSALRKRIRGLELTRWRRSPRRRLAIRRGCSPVGREWGAMSPPLRAF